MAAIDKIYGTRNQHIELRNWLLRNNPKALKYLYEEEIDNNEHRNRPISNFPEEIDKWLLENCPIEWVTDYIKLQYDL